jgi:hypothetical protein
MLPHFFIARYPIWPHALLWSTAPLAISLDSLVRSLLNDVHHGHDHDALEWHAQQLVGLHERLLNSGMTGDPHVNDALGKAFGVLTALAHREMPAFNDAIARVGPGEPTLRIIVQSYPVYMGRPLLTTTPSARFHYGNARAKVCLHFPSHLALLTPN